MKEFDLKKEVSKILFGYDQCLRERLCLTNDLLKFGKKCMDHAANEAYEKAIKECQAYIDNPYSPSWEAEFMGLQNRIRSLKSCEAGE